MAVGSHKDAFKAHQLVKKTVCKDGPSVLVKLAGEILLDFVKNQRQITPEASLPALPVDTTAYETDRLDLALHAVDSLCGKCEESHDDACFVNQARRVLIAARTGVDPGESFDGRTGLAELLARASALAADANPAASTVTTAVADVDAAAEVQQLRQAVESLQEQEVFRNTLIDEVVDTIKAVSEGNFAAEMPVHDDAQLGKLATAFNMMLGAINRGMRDLDRLVAERQAELRMIMDTVPVGLLSLDADGRINPEHSQAAATILGVETLRGRDFLDVLGLTRRRGDERETLQDFLDIVQQGLLPDEDLPELNPFAELQLPLDTATAAPRWLRLGYHPIPSSAGSASAILVQVEDISREKAMAARITASETENHQLKAIAEDPDLFREFIVEATTIFGQTDVLVEAAASTAEIDALFRGIHTIKGAAGSFDLQPLSTAAGELEEILKRSRTAGCIDQAMRPQLMQAYERLGAAWQQVMELARQLLGDDIQQASQLQLRLPVSALDNLLAAAADLPGTLPQAAALQAELRRLRQVPLHKALARSLRAVPGLAERLGKQVEFIVDGGELGVDCILGHELNTPLLHLLRNALDHGLEDPDQRLAAGKNPTGLLRLTASYANGGLQLLLQDDGRGIDPAKIRAAAVARGLITTEQAAACSDAEAIALIFQPGFSTASAVTDVSGRGVGMDAVRAAVETTLGGSLTVESQLGKGSCFSVHIPLP